MNHQKIIQKLVHSLCVDGVRPSVEIQKHLASCRLCFDSLAVLGELVKAGSSRSWYASESSKYPCEDIDAEMDWVAAMDANELVLKEPSIAGHISRCGLCAERYVSARHLLEAEY